MGRKIIRLSLEIRKDLLRYDKDSLTISLDATLSKGFVVTLTALFTALLEPLIKTLPVNSRC